MVESKDIFAIRNWFKTHEENGYSKSHKVAIISSSSDPLVCLLPILD